MFRSLGGGGQLTLTIYPNGLGNAKIGNQFLASWPSEIPGPYIINYSDIQDLSGQIEVYIDGRTTDHPVLTNISNEFFGMEYTSTYFRGYIIDKSKSSILNWSW